MDLPLPNTKLVDLPDDITPADALKLFGSELDAPIQQMLSALRAVGFTEDQFHELLDALNKVQNLVLDIPKELTIEQAQPYVRVSDLLVLGSLTFELYMRRDAIHEYVAEHGTTPNE